MMKNICKECGNLIIGKQKNAQYCKECTTPKKKRERYFKNNPELRIKQKKWAKKHRKQLNNSTRKSMKTMRKIINFLRDRYNVKLLDDVFSRLKEELK